MGRDMPPELHGVLRRIEDITAMHKEKLDFIQDRWATVRHRRSPDPEEVRRAAEHEDASAELVAIAAAVRDGRTTWPNVVAGEADHLPEVLAFYAAQRERLLAQVTEPPEATAPRRRTDPDDQETTIFEQW